MNTVWCEPALFLCMNGSNSCFGHVIGSVASLGTSPFPYPDCPIWAWSCTVILPSFFPVAASRSVSQNACHQQSWGCSYPKITSFSTSSGSEPQRASCHCSTDLCTATCRPLLACKKRVAALVGFWWRSTEEALPGILENSFRNWLRNSSALLAQVLQRCPTWKHLLFLPLKEWSCRRSVERPS